MPTGLSVRNRIANVLSRVNASARPVYLRDVVESGGDVLLGVGVTSTNIDTEVSPPPVVDVLPEDLVMTSGGLYQTGDYRMLFSGETDESDLRTKLICYGDKALKTVSVDPIAFNGVVVAWQVIGRTLQTAD